MKTIIKSAVSVIALAFLSTGVFAAKLPQPDITLDDVNAKVTYYDGVAGVDIQIDNVVEDQSSVTVYDAAGNVLLTDEFDNDDTTVQKSYLLADLTDGDYTIQVVTGDQVSAKTITLSSDNSDEQAFAF